MRIIRQTLGTLILSVDKITSPKSVSRTPEDQKIIDQKTSTLNLYEMLACPYCVKVRREVKRLGLNIKRIDIKKDPVDKDTLIKEGGKFQVPCLRIEQRQKNTEWLYESDDIIKFLRGLL